MAAVTTDLQASELYGTSQLIDGQFPYRCG
jgi:hypothetical protein